MYLRRMGVCPTPLHAYPPGCRTPFDADPPPLAADPPPGCRPPGHVTCDGCWEAKHPPLPPTQTNTCENITLPQTSFAGGKIEADVGLVQTRTTALYFAKIWSITEGVGWMHPC